jgi:hypothetical protein
MHLIVLFFFILFFIFFVRNSKSQNILVISLWLVFAYGFLLITHFFSGIKYQFGNIYDILPYFLFCLFLLYFGHVIGRTFKTRTFYRARKVKIHSIGLLSVFGSMIFVIELLRLNEINFGTRINDLTISTIGTIGNALSGLSLLVWLYSLYYYKINQIKLPLIAYLSVLCYVAGGVLSAGRQSIIILCISSIILLIWSSKKTTENFKKRPNIILKRNPVPWGFYFLLLLFSGYFLFVSDVRSGISDLYDKNKAYEEGFNATTTETTKKVSDLLGGFSDIYVESSYYYSHELIRLDLLYKYYDYPPLFGLSQMTYIERRMQWLIGKQGEASWRQEEIALEDKGRFSSHTWSTFVGNFIVDFGRIGALFACLIFGLILGILYRRFKDNDCPRTVVRQCVICTGIVFSIQFSPIAELIYFIPLVFSSFVILLPSTKPNHISINTIV